jgi:hypothetical protein
MKGAPEILALQQATETCRTHWRALDEALYDLGKRELTAADLDQLSKDDRRLDPTGFAGMKQRLDERRYRYA